MVVWGHLPPNAQVNHDKKYLPLSVILSFCHDTWTLFFGKQDMILNLFFLLFSLSFIYKSHYNEFQE